MNILKTVCGLATIQALIVGSVVGQVTPEAPQQKPIVLMGGSIHPMIGEEIEQGEILFVDGKIAALGKTVEHPKGTIEVDVSGKHIYPGLFESHSHMGLTEISAVRATNDYAETGAINPNVRALVSVNPDNVIIPVTRTNGVLFALTAPSSGLISGKSAVLQLDGWTYEDMSLKDEATMQINWPSQNISDGRRARMSEDEIRKELEQLGQRLKELDELFDTVRRYRDARSVAGSKQRYDARLEAMIDVVEGRLPIMVSANHAADIRSAVAFAVKQGVKLIILGGYDAEQCAELLKKHEVPVVISAIHRLPQRRDDAYDAAYSLPARLLKAGVKFCISGTDRSETWNARNLPNHAGTAAGFGLPVEEAIKAITIYPAEILGVADKIGSLEVGKDASLIVTDGNPLEATTQVELAYIQGRKLDLSNQHQRLYEKYQEKYRQLEAN